MNASDVNDYNSIALGINAPIYSFYAGRILEKTGIASGLCLDVGCGGGYLGLALARITTLDFVFIDASPEMLSCATVNIATHNLTTRAATLLGQVQAIPLPDESVDLVISRGSIPFWDELPTAFREIKRVLKPGGCGYIGGGLGDPKLRAAHMERMKKEHPEWHGGQRKIPRHDDRHYSDALESAGFDSFTVTRNDEGMWIELLKAKM
ncbi:MAG: class I SAM-dependent methyltransferase [Desulfuromonadales bacterium]|nr:class I SAM-dependent methyltransferase [Desulfuromonadales bacterium]